MLNHFTVPIAKTRPLERSPTGQSHARVAGKAIYIFLPLGGGWLARDPFAHPPRRRWRRRVPAEMRDEFRIAPEQLGALRRAHLLHPEVRQILLGEGSILHGWPRPRCLPNGPERARGVVKPGLAPPPRPLRRRLH